MGAFLILASRFGLALALLNGLSPVSAQPGSTVWYVAPYASCNGKSPCYASVQAAVDAAAAGDEIRVAAGSYTEVFTRSGQAQAVYIDKSLMVQGGYTPEDWNTPDPAVNFTTLDAQQQGRVITITGGITVTLAGLRITGGLPHDWSAGVDIFANGGGVSADGANVTLADNVIYGNTAGGSDLGNTFFRQGGGIYLANSTALLTNNQVIFNTATRSGGGVYLWHSGGTLNGNAISSNTTGGNGGGLCLVNSPVLITNNTIAHNQAPSFDLLNGQGGGLWMIDSAATLSGNTFVSNTASSFGGGLYVDAQNLTEGASTSLNGNTFTSNAADLGGGLYLRAEATASPAIMFAYNTVQANSAGRNGGGLSISSLGNGFNLSHNVIIANTAQSNGGGLAVSGSGLILVNNRIAENKTLSPTGRGAGLYASYSTGMLSGNKIIGNIASGNGLGGGLYLVNSPLNVGSSLILSNTAFDGAGLFLETSNAIFTNAVILNNFSNPNQNAVSICSSDPHFVHATVAFNNVSGAFYLTDLNGLFSSLELTNSIIAGHALGIKTDAGSTANLNGVLWYNNTTDTSGSGITVTNAFSGDPRFDLDGYHLLPGSMAASQGLNAGVLTDIDGQTRPNPVKPDARPDLGADEQYQEVFMPVIKK
jgi:parallel beta-helix repeat protein